MSAPHPILVLIAWLANGPRKKKQNSFCLLPPSEPRTLSKTEMEKKGERIHRGRKEGGKASQERVREEELV